MKMRENELHEPIIKTRYNEAEDFWQAIAFCPVCKAALPSGEWIREKTAIMFAKERVPNYCKYCGARLREVEA